MALPGPRHVSLVSSSANNKTVIRKPSVTFHRQMGSIDPPKAENGNTNTDKSDGGDHKTSSGDGVAPAGNEAAPESEALKKRKTNMLPLEVGTSVMCRWRDGKYHPVKVIERRKMPFSAPNDYEYYVHYNECK